MNSDTRKPVAVIGVGNPLYGDDGFGIAAIEALRKETLPPGVDLIDGGTLGVDLLEFLKDYRTVIIIDAAEMGLAPGTVRVFRPDEVRSLKPGHPLSLHHTDVLGVIELGKTLGETLADIYIVAVEPEVLEMREGLSAHVAVAFSSALREIRYIAG